MGLGGSLDGVAVTAAQGDNEGAVLLQDQGEDDLVATAKALHGDGEASEPISVEGIDTGLIEDELWIEVENGRHSSRKLQQVFVITGSVFQFDVQFAALFSEGKVLPAMHRKGKDVGIIFEDLGGSITLVNVEVDDGEA